MRDDYVYISDIANCISRIEAYTLTGKNDFMQNSIIQDAAVRKLEIISEAAKCLSKEFKSSHSEVPWRQISGLRDVLIHNYGRVDLAEVWQIVEQNLPEPKKQIQALLDQFTN